MLGRLQNLIGTEYQVIPFAQLSEAHQMAIAWYMVVDGSAWGGPDLHPSTPDALEQLQASLPFYVEHNGDELIGVTTITAKQAKDAVMSDHNPLNGKTRAEECGSFKKYHQQFLEQNLVWAYDADNRWPVILAQDLYIDTLADGYVRLHSYLRSGHTDIPVIFFPDACHLTEEQRQTQQQNLDRLLAAVGQTNEERT
jgi:hypothetical protein